MKINIVGAKNYDFTDQNSGKNVIGLNLYYIADQPFDDRLTGKLTGKINIGEKASKQVNVTELLNAKECEADFNQFGKLISLKPIF